MKLHGLINQQRPATINKEPAIATCVALGTNQETWAIWVTGPSNHTLIDLPGTGPVMSVAMGSAILIPKTPFAPHPDAKEPFYDYSVDADGIHLHFSLAQQRPEPVLITVERIGKVQPYR